MCKEIKVRKLPKGFKIRQRFIQWGIDFNRSVRDEIWGKHRNLIEEDIGCEHPYGSYSVLETKLMMLTFVKDYLKKEGIDMDEFNGLAPTRINAYKAYEYTALWVWSEIISFIKDGEMPKETWYKKYGPCVASVMKKYPKSRECLSHALTSAFLATSCLKSQRWRMRTLTTTIRTRCLTMERRPTSRRGF